MLIAFEGIDGTGKTTISKMMAEALNNIGTPTKWFRCPGDSSIGPQVRELIFNPALDRTAASLLIMADRAAIYREKIAPALEAGDTVIVDRFTASNLAYQCYGEGWSLMTVRDINTMSTLSRLADMTFLLDIPVHLAVQRSAKDSNFYGEDQLENLERVRDGYLRLHAKEHGWTLVESSGTINEVFGTVMGYYKNHVDAMERHAS